MVAQWRAYPPIHRMWKATKWWSLPHLCWMVHLQHLRPRAKTIYETQPSAILSHVGCQFMPVVCVVCPWDIATCTTKIQHFAPRHVGTWPSPLGSDSQPQPARDLITLDLLAACPKFIQVPLRNSQRWITVINLHVLFFMIFIFMMFIFMFLIFMSFMFMTFIFMIVIFIIIIIIIIIRRYSSNRPGDVLPLTLFSLDVTAASSWEGFTGCSQFSPSCVPSMLNARKVTTSITEMGRAKIRINRELNREIIQLLMFRLLVV